MENKVASDQEVSELRFKVQGLEQDIRELQKIVNQLLGNDEKHPASAKDTPVRPRRITTFEG